MAMFSLCHATARISTGQYLRAVLAWLSSRTGKHDVQYVVAADSEDEFGTIVPDIDRIPIERVVNAGRKCCVDAWNAAARAARGDYLIAVADDLLPCRGWDELIEQEMPDWTQPGALLVVDNLVGKTNTPVMTRALYDRRGYMWYPEYPSVYCDDDFVEAAQAEDVAVVPGNPALRFFHAHPSIDPATSWDAVYEKSNSRERYAAGKAILDRRRARNFRS